MVVRPRWRVVRCIGRHDNSRNFALQDEKTGCFNGFSVGFCAAQ
jgi:hypothetical protein